MKEVKSCLLIFIFVLLSFNTFSQQDTTESNLSFDIGITRGKNVNLWPIFKKLSTTWNVFFLFKKILIINCKLLIINY